MEGARPPAWGKSEVRVSRPRKTPQPTLQRRHRGSGPGGRGSGASAQSPWKWLLWGYCTPLLPCRDPRPSPHPLGRVWRGVSGCARVCGQRLTLLLSPVLQKRNRAITARRQHLKVGAARGRGPWRGSAGAAARTRPLTAARCPPSAERDAADSGHGAGEGGEPPGDGEAELPGGALRPAAHPQLHRRSAGACPPCLGFPIGREGRCGGAGQGWGRSGVRTASPLPRSRSSANSCTPRSTWPRRRSTTWR